MEDSGKEQVTLARIADILISLSEAAANFIKIQFTTLSSIRWIGCNLSMSQGTSHTTSLCKENWLMHITCIRYSSKHFIKWIMQKGKKLRCYECI